MKDKKNKRTMILTVILIGLLVVAYKVMFVSSVAIENSTEDVGSINKIESVLKQVESIKLDTSAFGDEKIKSLRSIEQQQLSLPIGKSNPFAP
jgi:hypothetical protein